MNIVVIKAGGVGSRMNAGVPKQFLCVEDKPVIIYTLEAFEKHPRIDAIIVVCVDGWHEILQSYAQKFHITKLVKIVSGGETSLKSIREGIRSACEEYHHDDTVLIHDANRPLVSQDTISDVIAQCRLFGSSVAAVVCTDEVMQTDAVDAGSARAFLDRKRLYRIQTPDAYNLGFISNMLENATEDQLNRLGAANTLMIEEGYTVHFAQGAETNIRLTTQEDILLFETLLKLRAKKV